MNLPIFSPTQLDGEGRALVSGSSSPSGFFSDELTRRSKVKTQAFSVRNKIWNNNFSSPKKVGAVMAAIEAVAPATKADWVLGYLSETRPLTAVLALGFELARMADISDLDATDEVISHVLDQTWDGYQAEQHALKWLNNHPKVAPHGPVLKANKHDDRYFRLDFILSGTSDPIYAFQLKPPSFFAGLRSGKLSYLTKELAPIYTKAEAHGFRIAFLNKQDIQQENYKPMPWRDVLSV